VTVKVVHTQEEFTQALGIRFAAYCAEQNCPWGEDVEGNDFSSTHVIAYVDGEPAATLRLRWFSSFVHMGRVGAVKRFRGGNAVPELIRYSFELCRRKGYTKAYGQAERALEGYWLMLGCKVINRGQPIVWSDHEYVEVTLDLDPHPEAITLASDPMTILRREGEWDVPGAIEASSMRGLQKVGFEDKGRDAA
jgi:predicted GNAT family N-acyltransferase